MANDEGRKRVYEDACAAVASVLDKKFDGLAPPSFELVPAEEFGVYLDVFDEARGALNTASDLLRKRKQKIEQDATNEQFTAKARGVISTLGRIPHFAGIGHALKDASAYFARINVPSTEDIPPKLCVGRTLITLFNKRRNGYSVRVTDGPLQYYLSYATVADFNAVHRPGLRAALGIDDETSPRNILAFLVLFVFLVLPGNAPKFEKEDGVFFAKEIEDCEANDAPYTVDVETLLRKIKSA